MSLAQNRKQLITFENLGGRTRTRTWDPLIKSQLLYQLSYAPETPPRVGPARAASCSKASSHCPAKARADVFPETLSSVRPGESGDPGPQIGCRGPGSRFSPGTRSRGFPLARE